VKREKTLIPSDLGECGKADSTQISQSLHLFGRFLVSHIEMKTIEPDTVREHVRARYGNIAVNGGGCCGSGMDAVAVKIATISGWVTRRWT